MKKNILLLLAFFSLLFTDINAQVNYGKPVPIADGFWVTGEYIGDYSEFSAKERKMIDKGYWFFNGVAMAQGSNKLFGLVDQNEKWVVSPKYNEIGVLQYSNLFKVRLKLKWGMIDKDGEVVIPVRYDDLGVVGKEESTDYEIFAKLNGKWGILDKWGKKILKPFLYEEYQYVSTDPEDTSSAMFGKVNGKWGMVSSWGGNTLIPFLYDSVYVSEDNASDIIALVKNKKLVFDKDGIPQTGLANKPKEVEAKNTEPVVETISPVISATGKSLEQAVTKNQTPAVTQIIKPKETRDENVERILSRLWQAYQYKENGNWEKFNTDPGDDYNCFYYHFKPGGKIIEYDYLDEDDGTWRYDASSSRLYITTKTGSGDNAKEYADTFILRSVSEDKIQMDNANRDGSAIFRSVPVPGFVINPRTISHLINNLSFASGDAAGYFRMFGEKPRKTESKDGIRFTYYGPSDDYTVTSIENDICGYTCTLNKEIYKDMLSEIKRKGYTEYQPSDKSVDKSFKSGRYTIHFFNVNKEDWVLGVFQPIYVRVVDTEFLKVD